jgi:hypothetical protein
VVFKWPPHTVTLPEWLGSSAQGIFPFLVRLSLSVLASLSLSLSEPGSRWFPVGLLRVWVAQLLWQVVGVVVRGASAQVFRLREVHRSQYIDDSESAIFVFLHFGASLCAIFGGTGSRAAHTVLLAPCSSLPCSEITLWNGFPRVRIGPHLPAIEKPGEKEIKNGEVFFGGNEPRQCEGP